MDAGAGFAQRRLLVAGAGAVVGLAAVLVLLGWVFGVEVLRSIVPGWPSMVPASALCFLLTSLSLLLLATRRFSAALMQACATPAVLVAVARLLELAAAAQWNVSFLGIATGASGSMSPATALDFLLLDIALLLTIRSRAPCTAQALSLVALLVAWLGVSRYVYGGEPLLAWAAMGFHTALCFAVLSVGILACGERVGLVGLLTSRGAGGASVRRLLPAAVVLPLALAWLPLMAGHTNWLGREAALSLFALSMVVIFGALVWMHAARLEQADRQRQEASDALSASEERLRLIIEGALDAVVTIDRNGDITGWNVGAEMLFGWSRGEAIGRSLGDTIVPPRYAQAHQGGLQRFLETGESRVLNQRVELAAVRRNGREFPIEIAITPVQTSTGIAFCAFVRDITERREALAALHESELRFRTIAEALPHLVWTCRPDGWCDYLSRQWVEYTGHPEAGQLGYGWVEYLHPQDRERVRSEWEAAIARGDHFEMEFRIRRHDGVHRWFKTRAAPLRDAAGNIFKWFGSNTDIEDYKTSQHKLRTQIERLHLLDQSTRAIGERQDLGSIFQTVLGSLETGLAVDFACICTHDAVDGTLTVTCVGADSRGFAAALGLQHGTRVDIEANGLARAVSGRLVHEPDLAGSTLPFSQRLMQAGLGSVVLAPLAVESKVFGVLVAARRNPASFSSNDCEFLGQLSAHVALAANQAELYGTLQVAYDDLRRTQQAVMQQERLRALGQMASGIAHDINNALSPAALYTQSMLEHETGLSAEGRRQLGVVEQAVDSVAATISRLREFYRDRETQQVRELVQPNKAIEQAAGLTRARWQDMPQQLGIVVELTMELAPDLPTIVGTASELRDAITNLILNAVDAMPAGGKLTLRSRLIPSAGAAAPAQVEIAVRDTGIGMSAETRSRCLDPFYTTKGERGTGLGLAMVYGMLERHGARIEIDSKPELGTEMRLLFPVSTDATRGAAIGPTAVPRALQVLLVDDDPVLLNTLREILEGDGHHITIADGGQAGIDALHSMEATGRPCVVLVTDLGMPHVDGRKVAAAAKSLRHPPAVVMLTGWGQRLVDEGQMPPHVDRVLSKPPKLLELRSALAELTS